MSDLLVVARLEWKRFKGEAAYWLPVFGFETGNSPLYPIYITAFWCVWVYAVWAYIADQVLAASLQAPADMVTGLGQITPGLFLLLQLGYAVYVLRDIPLKFSAPDLLYVAASPISRGAIALVALIRAMVIPALIVGLLSALYSMFLTWPISEHQFGIAGLEAFLLGILIVYLSGALAWSLALLRLHPDLYRYRRTFWLIVPLIVLLAILLPAVILAPGHLWLSTVDAQMSIVGAITLILSLIIALILLYWVGNGIHMTRVMDASQTYARIQRLGIVGRVYASDVIARINRQARLARKRRLRFTLPVNLHGYPMIAGRALLNTMRFAPGSISKPFFRGMGLTAMIAFLIQFSGWQALQTWLLVLILVVQSRPAFLTEYFEQDVSLPFLRQYLPSNNLYRLIASAFIPLLLACVGGLLTVFALPIDPLAGAMIVIFSLTGTTLLLALEQVNERQFFYRSLPYPYSMVACSVIVIAAGVFTSSLYGASLALILLNLLLGWMMAHSEDVF